jgi:xanthine dehydrogenase molybdenum-binding subunit
MIPFDFIYHRPRSLAEAVEAYAQADRDGLTPAYLAGGTEITTFCRMGKMKPGALVDIKRIPECCARGVEGNELVFGAALTLNDVIEGDSFPLLRQASVLVDHTVRNRLTLGGNIAGMLPYRETVLPFLLADATARLVSPTGERRVPLAEVFSEQLRLGPGELLAQVRVPKAMASQASFYRRRVRKGRFDYPLVTVCCLQVNKALRMAVSGAFSFPLRCGESEKVLNDGAIPLAKRPAAVIDSFPHTLVEDMRASAAYRRMLFQKCVGEALAALKEAK